MKKAFTLAEVLIVLVIVGVIAALLISALVENTQKKEYSTALQKFYSQTSQALLQISNDYGSPGDLGNAKVSGQIISQYFKKAKDCGTSTTDNCWASTNRNYDGSSANITDDDTVAETYKFITVDGMSIYIDYSFPGCTDDATSDHNQNSPVYNVCGWIDVDVNGLKGPNTAGRDVFEFLITSNKTPLLYPSGGKDYYPWGADGSCQPSNKNGWGCAARVMEENWQMNY